MCSIKVPSLSLAGTKRKLVGALAPLVITVVLVSHPSLIGALAEAPHLPLPCRAALDNLMPGLNL